MSEIKIFITTLMILLLLAIFVPIFNMIFESETPSGEATALEETVSGSSYLTIMVNMLFIYFWTFGLNTWINLLILTPIRIVGLITAYYIIVPTK